jgi:hypothetical protein
MNLSLTHISSKSRVADTLLFIDAAQIVIDLMVIAAGYPANGDLTDKKRVRLKRLID